MFKKIFREIKKYDTIVIVRHIGVDPDALSSQLALRDSIRLTFPEKKVLAVGTGTSRFSFIGRLDKMEAVSNALLIILDTPDKKRVDGVRLEDYASVIKIDHHPFIEPLGNIEYVVDTASSTCEIIMDLILNTKLLCNQNIARMLYAGLVSDSNRFMFESSTSKTFALVSKFLEMYPFSIKEVYEQMYLRPLSEVRFEGYLAQNMTVTDHGVSYIIITDDIINKYKVDTAAAGNMINNFNFISEVLVWVTVTEDIKNENIRISIRSRGPAINKVAEAHHGGGHKYASGVKTTTFEEAQFIIRELDAVSREYIESMEEVSDDGN